MKVLFLLLSAASTVICGNLLAQENPNGTNSMSIARSPTQSDRIITEKILAKIKSDPTLSEDAKYVWVTTVNGVVTLHGPVSSETEKEAIERLTYEVGGVTSVQNDLVFTEKNRSI